MALDEVLVNGPDTPGSATITDVDSPSQGVRDMYDKLYGKTGVCTIVGSGLMWAWFDAFYMSSFFPNCGAGFTSEGSIALVFALSVIPLLFALMNRSWAESFLRSQRNIVSVGIVGSLGSLLLVVSDVTDAHPAPLVAGCILCALAMAFMTVAWGGVYAQGGSITATPYVSGAFACAIIVDFPLFFMQQEASAVFYAVLPLLSCVVLRGVAPEDRDYASILDSSVVVDSPIRQESLRGALTGKLGVPLSILCGYVFVMFGFAYLQHLISFSPVMSGGHAYGVLVQAVRGVVALGMFAFIYRNLNSSRLAYRIGLPVMITGCMTLTFTFDNGLFVLSAAAIIAGYTAFDLFVWVIYSSIACTQSRNPIGTIIAMRVTCAVGHTAGALTGLLLVGFDTQASPFLAELTTFACYFIVIAVVLLLNSEEVFALSNGYFDFRGVASALRKRFSTDQVQHGAEEGGEKGECPSADNELVEETGTDSLLDARFSELGLTARERDVARQLTHGRTQKWIADYLCISENTVGTHLRRIYQKAGVHTRQQFLDVLTADSSASHEIHDID